MSGRGGRENDAIFKPWKTGGLLALCAPDGFQPRLALGKEGSRQHPHQCWCNENRIECFGVFMRQAESSVSRQMNRPLVLVSSTASGKWSLFIKLVDGAKDGDFVGRITVLLHLELGQVPSELRLRQRFNA